MISRSFGRIKLTHDRELEAADLPGTRLHRLHGHRNIAVRRDEDGRELPVGRIKLTLELEAASPRHSHIDDQADRALGPLSLEEIANG
jgi:hypothetical protein